MPSGHNRGGQGTIMDKKFIDLYDEYTHAPLDRRVFISRLTALAGSTAAASALLPLLENNYALAQVVPPADARLVHYVGTYRFHGQSYLRATRDAIAGLSAS